MKLGRIQKEALLYLAARDAGIGDDPSAARISEMQELWNASDVSMMLAYARSSQVKVRQAGERELAVARLNAQLVPVLEIAMQLDEPERLMASKALHRALRVLEQAELAGQMLMAMMFGRCQSVYSFATGEPENTVSPYFGRGYTIAGWYITPSGREVAKRIRTER